MMAARVTDRAERYRANKMLPVAGKSCLLCGSTRNLVPDHWDGHPDHTNPANLEVLCKSCNTSKGAAFAKVGRGRLTHQYNPTKGGGAATIGEWMQAVGSITPHIDRGDRGLVSTMSTRDAVDMIRATPQSKRRDFAAQLRRRNPATRQRSIYDFEDAERAGRDRARELQASTGRSYGYKADTIKSQFDIWWGQHSEGVPLQEQRFKLGTKAENYSAYARQWRAFTKVNPWPFSRPDARRTTPAHGGIEYHTRRKRADEGNVEFLKSKRPAKGKAARVAASMPDEAALQAGFARGLTLNEMLRANPALRKSRQSNPAKFDRCVKAVQAKGGAANAYAVCTAAGTRKRNPAAGAAEVFEEFHGFEPSEVVTVTKHIHHHEHLAAAGKLTHLDVWGVDDAGHKITGFKGAFLAFNESKNQLFVEGGDQAVNLDDFGIEQAHELETLGRLTDIGYQTNKTHLGDEGGEAVYVHRFRSTNENGKHVVVKIARYPDLIYDVRNEQLLFSGGSYEILREGINK